MEAPGGAEGPVKPQQPLLALVQGPFGGVRRGDAQNFTEGHRRPVVRNAAAGFPVHNRVPADPEPFGQGLLGEAGVFAGLPDALAREGVPINTANQGAGKLNLLVGVPEERYGDAIRAIYAAIDDSV